MYYREIKGKWYFTIYVQMPNGTSKKVERVGGKTLTQAKAACRRFIQREREWAVTHSGEAITMGTFLREWIDEYGDLVSYNTYRSYRNVIEKHVLPSLGKIKLQRLTTHQLQSFFLIKAHHVSNNTIKLMAAVLKRALRQAIDVYHYLILNPMDGVILPKPELYREVQIFSHKDLDRIFAYFNPENPLYIPIMIAYYTGMRRGEILALSWDAIDFDEHLIHVFRNIHVEGGVVSVREGTKTRRQRWVGLNQHLEEILLQHKKWQNNQRKEYGPLYKKSKYVCTLPDGSLIHPNNIRWFNLWCKKNNINGTFHTFRHTFATRMLELGMDLDAVAKTLGHTNISTTSSVYLHLTKTRQAQCLDFINKLP